VFLFAHLTFTNHFTDLFFPQVHYLQERSGLKWSIEENQEITSSDSIEYKGSEINTTEWTRAACGHFLPGGTTDFIKAKPLLCYFPHLV